MWQADQRFNVCHNLQPFLKMCFTLLKTLPNYFQFYQVPRSILLPNHFYTKWGNSISIRQHWVLMQIAEYLNCHDLPFLLLGATISYDSIVSPSHHSSFVFLSDLSYFLLLFFWINSQKYTMISSTIANQN